MSPALAFKRDDRAPDAMSAHRPVMLQEALAGLDVRSGGIYVDATYGRGGHSAAILERLGGDGTLHALDRDADALRDAVIRFGKTSNFKVHAVSFSRLAELAAREGIEGRVNGILFDLGVSSPQFDDPARGFSFTYDGPLDMRMDRSRGETAAAWLARAREDEIADVLWRYGEERASRRIARALVAARARAQIETTQQLARIIAAAAPGPRRRIHPATRSFQAIRIHVNRELDELEAALPQAAAALAPGGRLAVISFHSLEDRMVKRFIRESGIGNRESGAPSLPLPRKRGRERVGVYGDARLKPIARHFPSAAECESNPRARSAVLRVAERLPEHVS